ncbi:MAG: hypothetical protein WC988_01970 [Patescibacteria group bacterium]
MLQKVFAIGNSVAVTIPRRFGILPGTRLRHVSTRKNRISYEIIEEPEKKQMSDHEIEEYVRSHTGKIKLNASTQEVMEIIKYCRENPYEKF